MNPIYTLESLAVKAVYDFNTSMFDGIEREVIKLDSGGFQIYPPLPVYDAEQSSASNKPVNDFLTGEQIPPEVRNKPQPPRNSHNKILDDDSDYIELDLLKHLDDSHITKKLSKTTAYAIQLPVSTVFLTGIVDCLPSLCGEL